MHESEQTAIIPYSVAKAPKKKPRRKPSATRQRRQKTASAEPVTAVAVIDPQALSQYSAAERSQILYDLVLSTLSANTRKAYAQDIETFGRWWKTDTPLPDLIAFESPGPARAVCVRYQAALMKAGNSTATIARRLRSLNSIIKKLHFAGMVGWTLDMPVAKIEALKDVRGPGKTKWKKLLKTVEKDDRWLGARDLAMLRLMGNDNLRASEVCNLRHPKDVRTVEKRMEIYVQGKGGKNLWHPLHPRSRQTLEAWLRVRADVIETRGQDVPWLFFSQRFRLLTNKRVWERVSLRAEEAGIGELHPHALRHYAITDKAKNWRGSQTSLTRWARHSDANMTQRYVDEAKDEIFQISQLGDDD